ncbi:MAG: 2-oxoglutarate dehydrogenase E1 component [Sphaerobacter thermophilus]|uniref:2-oxoglutarate dehydrogenase E1 component n=1 Tax=Sphaerobacter thermophilus TaxID=2057 RepID=UPI00396DA4A9
MSVMSRFHGPNAGYVLELYDRYLRDPESVDPETRAIFERWAPEPDGAVATAVAEAAPGVDVAKVVAAANLAQSIRSHGHRAARLDPLGSEPPGDSSLDPAAHGLTEADLAALPATVVGGPAAQGARNAAEAIANLRRIYCGTIGYDFGHVQIAEEREWLQEAVESGRFARPLTAEQKRALLQRLTEVESFEQFLHRAFIGQKRFSIEGTDMLVPMLDEIIREAVEAGTSDIIIGAAHRGRLNVLAHVLGKPYAKIIAEFMGVNHREPAAATEGGSSGWTGDVKYHMGAVRHAPEIHARLSMSSNPSHLEFVNPVVQGMTRAAQENREQGGPPQQDVRRALSILIHGDAAFPGEGIVAETLNLSRLPGYQVGGTLHIIANNQIGFTTEPWQARSTHYASDPARGFEIPIVHVNADDPVACLIATRLAVAYRQRFHKDFLIDLVGYRRWGHNEGDEPGFTQPRMYEIVSRHPTVRDIWVASLVDEGVVTKDEADSMKQAALNKLQEIRNAVAHGEEGGEPLVEESVDPRVRHVETAVPLDVLIQLNEEIHRLPEGFNLNPKLRRQMQRRVAAVAEGGPLDWAHAESLAFASILRDGTPIRMAGQDAERGTFSQRHLVFHDVETGDRFVPLQQMPSARASFAIHNSPLSEAGALGFEYGYSLEAPEALVIWEAQFGDFANVAQVIIDQFIVAARSKWQENPSLTLLLPHGYEGQGPEHSSARLERFLQLAADDNVRVANCTTSAQYFHLLRKQAALLKSAPRPLIVMTPKSLLRHPAAASLPVDLAEGRFQPVLDDPEAAERREEIGRVILCSGKVYVDLITSEARKAGAPVAIVRVEQLYPFPEEDLRRVLESYRNAREVVWLQEEPANMGAWTYMEPRLRRIIGPDLDLRYIGRPERASPAEGFHEVHVVEQGRIVAEAFAGVASPRVKTYGVQHAG